MSNIALLNHFDNAEVFSYSGNACQSDGGIFNSKCALFPDTNSFVNISNHSGLFNLSPGNSCEFEFFIRPDNINRINSEQEQEMYNAGFRWFNGHSFKIIPGTISWDNAKAYCEALHGHLAVIHDNDKHNFIDSLITDIQGAASDGRVWIGATYENGILNWVDGVQETTAQENWYPGNPDGYGYAIHLYNAAGGHYLFDDIIPTDGYIRGFICEWDFDTRLTSSSYSYIRWKYAVDFFNGHSFKLFHSQDIISWHDAKAACEALGGHLATIPNSEKNSFITAFIQNNNVSADDNDRICIGGTDENTEGVWQWVTGETFSFFNFYPAEPNDTNHSQNYLILLKNGKWDDCVDYTTDFPNHFYLCEWDYLYDDLLKFEGNIPVLNIGNDLALSLVSNGHFKLTSSSWNIDASSQDVCISPNATPAWHHILLRFYNQNAYLFLNGNLVISAPVSGNSITPNNVSLGGFVGNLDEFVFRNGNNIAYSSYVNVPTKPYGSSGDNNAPVTRAIWSCNNLPQGLTLSQSGLLTGHPTKAGTYDCNFSVSTNWGTANKTLRIVIQ